MKNPVVLSSIVALVVGIVSAATTLAVARRQAKTAEREAGGRVETTDANRLWEASEKIREDLTAEAMRLREENGRIRQRLVELEETTMTQVGLISEQNSVIAGLRKEIAALSARMDAQDGGAA